MEIYQELLSDVKKYIKNHEQYTLEKYQHEFKNTMSALCKAKEIRKGMKCLEVGVGTGWFTVYATKEYGLICDSIEISPHIRDFANTFITKYGVKPNILLGNIENASIPDNYYDLIIACSVFEHVEKYIDGLENIYKSLKPGGAFYFTSNNRYSLTWKSGEFWLPFYDILPDKMRYKIRILIQGEDIMKLGIDFNTFTNKQLRNIFINLGYKKIYDHIDLKDVTPIKKSIVRRVFNYASKNDDIKKYIRPFISSQFVCVK